MKQEIITNIIKEMLPHLDNAQVRQLQKVLETEFLGVEVTQKEPSKEF